MAVETGILPARYRDPKLVARGGMGEVYCATDTSLGRAVAVKLLDGRVAADDTVRKRFTREALAAARVSGEAGSVTIFDVGEWNNRPFIVMEYLNGGSLQDVIDSAGPQPPKRVLPWLEQAARALDHAHAHGVVHRDVKPANLLLDKQDRLHVADFGVATAAGLATLTQTGTIIGTTGYLSPEQAQGWESSPASDRYALAVVAFELLTGSRPFANTSQAAEAAAHVNTPVPSAAQRSHELPPQVDPVFERALAKSPEDRFSSCGEFVASLRAALDDAAGATRPSVPAFHTPRRSLALPLVIALLLAAGIAAAVYVATRSKGDARPTARVTITRQGTTVHETVTAQAPTTEAVATSTPAGGSSSSGSTSASSLAQRGYDKLQSGDYAGAVPLLQQAAQSLQGSGTISEAYNDYNLAYALAKTQGCSSQVVQLLDASEAIQGHRSEISRLRAACHAHP